MIKILSGLILTFISLWTTAQVPTGIYSGYLNLSPAVFGYDSLYTELRIEQVNDSTYRWHTRYNDSLDKDYLLRVHDGNYFLDEQNGILIPGELTGNSLYFLYTVDSVIYRMDYSWNDNQLVIDLRYYGKSNEVLNEGFRIAGYFPQGRQYAVLRKKNKP